MWPQAFSNPPTPAGSGVLGVWGGGEGFQFLGISKSKGWIKLKARVGGLVTRVLPNVSRGGSIPMDRA